MADNFKKIARDIARVCYVNKVKLEGKIIMLSEHADFQTYDDSEDGVSCIVTRHVRDVTANYSRRGGAK